MSSAKMQLPASMLNLDHRNLHHHDHHHAQTPPSNLHDGDTYQTMVSHFASDCTEDDVDQQFLRMAIDLGITIPQTPGTTLHRVADNISALSRDAIPDHSPSSSRTSQSTQPISDSSSEYKQASKTSSMTTVSIASPPASITSSSSRRSSYSSFKKNLQRFSSFRRRKTSDVSISAIPVSTPVLMAFGPSVQEQTEIKGATSVTSIPPNSVASTEDDAPRIEPAPQTSCVEETKAGEDEEEVLAARQRSLGNTELQNLRVHQFEEQSRFIQFEASQYNRMQLNQSDTKQALLDKYNRQTEVLRGRHVDALTSLEHRHLSAEVDLRRTLQLEKQGCETRLRHMQAYCDPESQIEGMPTRTVTKRDYLQLEQQCHVRNVIDNLHAARINVLREKQTKQLERVTAKQESELRALADELRTETEGLDATFEEEEQPLRREFSERKTQLVARWTLAEAIERRRLENTMGELYGPLPVIPWPDRRSVAGTGEVEQADQGFAHEAVMAYEATTIPIIGVDV